MLYTIRLYEPQDLDSVFYAWESASQVAHPFLSAAFLAQERENIPKLYLPNAETWVADNGDEVVGFASLLGDELGAIFVQTKFHGTGAGRALMDNAKSLHPVLFVEVFEANAIGRRFYDKCGFQQVSSYHHEETAQTMLRLKFAPKG